MVRRQTRSPAANNLGRRFTDNTAGPTTVVCEEMELRGEAQCSGNLELRGTLQGTCALGGMLVVRPQGRLLGNATVNDAIVEGKVEGDITAERKIELRSTCRVIGNITGQSVAIAEGGYFEGNIAMTSGAAAAQESPTAGGTPAADAPARPTSFTERRKQHE